MLEPRQEPKATSKPLTVFTASVFPDVARLWHAVVSRAFPSQDAKLEIFADCQGGFDPALFPGAELHSPTPRRRDHHEAYNDAVRRVSTPYLAIIDSDVFWLSSRIWPRVQDCLNDPRVAAMGCVSRRRVKSHGTFSVVLKPAIYRELLETLPTGFCKAVADPALPVHQWAWADTGDLITEQARRAGYDVQLHHLDQTGEIVRFDTITVFRLATRLADLWDLERETTGTFFWRGCLGNLILKRIHDRLFPEGPAYDFSVDPRRLSHALSRRGSRESARLALFWKTLCQKAARLEKWLGLPPSPRLSRSPRSFVHLPRSEPSILPVVHPRRETGILPVVGSKSDRSISPVAPPSRNRTLSVGEFYHQASFGPETVNQGAVLMACDWNGGVFLSGSMLGGIFWSGEFRGGTFWGGVFLDGVWTSGVWLHGFDKRGKFRHAGDAPGLCGPSPHAGSTTDGR